MSKLEPLYTDKLIPRVHYPKITEAEWRSRCSSAERSTALLREAFIVSSGLAIGLAVTTVGLILYAAFR